MIIWAMRKIFPDACGNFLLALFLRSGSCEQIDEDIDAVESDGPALRSNFISPLTTTAGSFANFGLITSPTSASWFIFQPFGTIKNYNHIKIYDLHFDFIQNRFEIISFKVFFYRNFTKVRYALF